MDDLLYHTLVIDSQVEMWLGCFHFLVIYSAVMSTHVTCLFFLHEHVFSILLGICLDRDLLGNITTPRLTFQKGAKAFFKKAVPLLFPQTMNG